MSATLGCGVAALNPPALGAGREAQGNGLAEVSRASYLPEPACSHKSQNRVPGRDVNSEMQRQLQSKTAERDGQGSCLLPPQVSEGSLERARAFGGHRPRYHPPSLQKDLKLCQLRLYERAHLRLWGGEDRSFSAHTAPPRKFFSESHLKPSCYSSSSSFSRRSSWPPPLLSEVRRLIYIC